MAKIDSLRASSHHFRRIRPDGNCFYRAYFFGILERAITAPAVGVEIDLIRTHLKSLAERCKESGYEAFAVDDFFEYVDEKLSDLSINPTMEMLRTQVFSDVSGDGYLMAFMRCCCGTFIKENASEFEAFLPNEYSTCHDFVRGEVDPMFRDCDNIQISALSRALQVPLKIVYLDQTEGPATCHVFGPPEVRSREVKLLYKPGHYDILY